MANYSVKDRLAQALAPLQRKLVDKVVRIEGIPVQVLKVTVRKVGRSGDTVKSFDFEVLSDVIMRFPISEMEILESLKEDGGVEVNSLDLWELLPTRMVTYFSGNVETTASKVKKGDLIVHVLRDENNNKIPVIFQVSRPIGRFMATKYLTKREWDLSKYRGVAETEIREKIEEYVEALE